jgi:hypothetical protein
MTHAHKSDTGRGLALGLDLESRFRTHWALFYASELEVSREKIMLNQLHQDIRSSRKGAEKC